MDLSPLLTHIKKQQSQGINQSEITNQLLSAGWDKTVIEQAFLVVTNNIPLPQTHIDSSYPSTSHNEDMWSVFQNILNFIALAFFAGSLHSLWTQFISHWLPVKDHYNYIGTYLLNSSIATLIISTPIFLCLFILTNLISPGYTKPQS